MCVGLGFPTPPGGDDVGEEECEPAVIVQPPDVDGPGPLAHMLRLEHLDVGHRLLCQGHPVGSPVHCRGHLPAIWENGTFTWSKAKIQGKDVQKTLDLVNFSPLFHSRNFDLAKSAFFQRKVCQLANIVALGQTRVKTFNLE